MELLPGKVVRSFRKEGGKDMHEKVFYFIYNIYM